MSCDSRVQSSLCLFVSNLCPSTRRCSSAATAPACHRAAAASKICGVVLGAVMAVHNIFCSAAAVCGVFLSLIIVRLCLCAHQLLALVRLLTRFLSLRLLRPLNFRTCRYAYNFIYIMFALQRVCYCGTNIASVSLEPYTIVNDCFAGRLPHLPAITIRTVSWWVRWSSLFLFHRVEAFSLWR